VGIVAFSRTGSEPFTWWSWWSSVRESDEPFSYGEPAGNPWWHAAYLVGLCACATVAAVYRDRSQWPKLVMVGLPVAAVTVLPGLLQLP
jgi:hypothetical protein